MTTTRPEYIRIYADSPIDAIWTHYRRFETIDTTRRTFGEWLSQESAIAARDCIRQAREYFLAARSSSLLTKPVLLYYGMISLSKLLFLFNRSQPYTMDQIEAIEQNGHGLKHFDPPGGGIQYQVEAGFLEIKSKRDKPPHAPYGIFPHLAAIVTGAPIDAWLKKQVAIKDVLRAIPQLDTMMRQVLGPSAGYSGLPVTVVISVDGSAELIVRKDVAGVVDADAAHERVPYLDRSRFTFGVPTSGPRGLQAESIALRLDTAEIGYDLIVREEFYHGTDTLPPALHGIRFDSLLSSYMAMYALSIIARYKPHKWTRILDGSDSSLLPVIETQMMVCERWWPNLLLNRLTGTWIHFGHPLYGG